MPEEAAFLTGPAARQPQARPRGLPAPGLPLACLPSSPSSAAAGAPQLRAAQLPDPGEPAATRRPSTQLSPPPAASRGEQDQVLLCPFWPAAAPAPAPPPFVRLPAPQPCPASLFPQSVHYPWQEKKCQHRLGLLPQQSQKLFLLG